MPRPRSSSTASSSETCLGCLALCRHGSRRLRLAARADHASRRQRCRGCPAAAGPHCHDYKPVERRFAAEPPPSGVAPGLSAARISHSHIVADQPCRGQAAEPPAAPRRSQAQADVPPEPSPLNNYQAGNSGGIRLVSDASHMGTGGLTPNTVTPSPQTTPERNATPDVEPDVDIHAPLPRQPPPVDPATGRR